MKSLGHTAPQGTGNYPKALGLPSGTHAFTNARQVRSRTWPYNWSYNASAAGNGPGLTTWMQCPANPHGKGVFSRNELSIHCNWAILSSILWALREKSASSSMMKGLNTIPSNLGLIITVGAYHDSQEFAGIFSWEHNGKSLEPAWTSYCVALDFALGWILVTVLLRVEVINKNGGSLDEAILQL